MAKWNLPNATGTNESKSICPEYENQFAQRQGNYRKTETDVRNWQKFSNQSVVRKMFIQEVTAIVRPKDTQVEKAKDRWKESLQKCLYVWLDTLGSFHDHVYTR